MRRRLLLFVRYFNLVGTCMDVNCRTLFSVRVFLTACSLIMLGGCSDPQAEQRAKICKGAGVTGELLKACRGSWKEYNRIMEPIRSQREKNEMQEFYRALKALPERTIPKDRYETVSLEKLNKEHGDLDLLEESKMSKHALFGKRFKVEGRIVYHPTDFEAKLDQRFFLEKKDASDHMNTWSVAADLESLGREERAFIKTHCEYLLDDCQGEFWGTIGPIEGDGFRSLGLQIEYMEIILRDAKK